MKRTIPLLFTALLLSSCTMYFKSEESINNDSQKAIKKQASFDLNCPSEELVFTDLDTKEANFQGIKVPLKWGVTGCEKRAVYVWAKGVGWINNTASK